MSAHPDHPRNYTPGLPVTGAWREGMPVGNRQFAHMDPDRPFVLESGETLKGITVAFETWGNLDDSKSNAVLVCHALTGDTHAHGRMAPGHAGPGWWNGVIGPGCGIDTDRYFVVCANVLGGCQGTTGPASVNPETQKPYGSSFPTVTIRDTVRTQQILLDHLGIDRWLGVVGGSMGGMQVLEWGVMFPDRVRSLAPLASAMAASAQQIAWSAAGRTALVLDPRFNGGDYYDAAPGEGPHAGLAVARSIAQIHYRSDQVFQKQFQRDLVDPYKVFGKWDRFQVESYMDYHGEKLVRRFDANSYLRLNRMMDLHDLARDRGSYHAALKRIDAPMLNMSLSTDFLYPPYQQLELHRAFQETGGISEYVVVDSPAGHDGFLLETRTVGAAVGDLLELAEKG